MIDQMTTMAELAETLERVSRLVRDLAATGAFTDDECGALARSLIRASLITHSAVLRMPAAPIH